VNGFDINTNLHYSHVTLLSNHYSDITILEYLLDNGSDINTKSTGGNPFIENLITYNCTLVVAYHKDFRKLKSRSKI
jgi:ankyrin repeat protein